MQKNESELVKEIEAWMDIFDKRGYAEFVVDAPNAEALFATLQRAREALSKAQDELLLLSEQVDHLGHPIIARQLLDIRDILTYTPEES